MARTDTEAFADFADFVAARSTALQRAAYLVVGERGLAEDLVQEALIRTYVRWGRLRDPRAAEAYTRRAITTTAIDWYRRRGWDGERPTETLPEVGAGGHADAVARSATLWAALQALPPRQRAAVVLRYYEDLTEAQTADALGCSVGTVKSQVSKALASLRGRLGDHADLLPLDDLVVTR